MNDSTDFIKQKGRSHTKSKSPAFICLTQKASMGVLAETERLTCLLLP
jgi:hypothetical protein